MSSAYLRLLISLLAILIPVCASPSPAFLMMYSAYKLNKQGDNLQPWHIPFPIWNQSVVPCPVLTAASWPAYRNLKGQVRWSGILISLKIFQFVVVHIVKGSGVVNKAEIDVFLEFSYYFYDPTDVGNLISGFYAFSKSSLNIWKFTVHTLLKSGLENFQHYFTSVCDKCNCAVLLTVFGIAFIWNCNESWLFQPCGHCRVFQICWHIECTPFIALSFRYRNSSTGFLSPPLALFIVMLLRPTDSAFRGIWFYVSDHTIVIMI